MNVRVLITAGATREPLDPVRFISNASTGKQGAALAREAVRRGWSVNLVHGPLEVKIPMGVVSHPVGTASEMLETCRRLHPTCDVVIGAAAVSDYRPEEVLAGKRRRESRPWLVRLVPTEDILADLGKRKEGKVHVGFALETEMVPDNLLRKLREKNLDFLVANPPTAIGAPSSEYLLALPDGSIRSLGTLTKELLARTLCDEVEGLLRGR